ncbi:unnamed protein product [Cladocopium goreaui]|uniref:7,8-didemethyl-8-hydroxy-5-deazariboflavin synthase n=1 Tax=Cladocopium goreaui TaxID=2562237 RepID=A0A9P1C2B7_9DINO|nr:unnamed protein product [Cladocopium goreaui]
MVPGSAFLETPADEPLEFPGLGGVLPAWSVGYCTGWRRSVTLLICLEGVRTLSIPLEDLTHEFKESLVAIYVTAGVYTNVRDVVFTNRGITLGSTKTRRPPNAFNFLRQLEILQKGGFDGGSFSEWDNRTKIQKAFQIGPKEAGAVSNLQDKISKTVVAQLREDIRSRGMNKWISHDVLARDVFNCGFSSGHGIFESWAEHCTNAADDRLVLLFLERLRVDWDKQNNRSCWTVKDALTLHAVSGAFLFLRDSLHAKVPQADFKNCIDDIDEQFRKGFLDAELHQLLSTSVPPTTLNDVSFMRRLAMHFNVVGLGQFI